MFYKLECMHHAFTKKVFYFKQLKNAQKFAEKLERNYNKIQFREHQKLTWTNIEGHDDVIVAMAKYSAFYYIHTIKTED